MEKTKSKQRKILLIGISALSVVGVLSYPLLRGNTREQFNSLILHERENPVYQQVRGKEYGELIAVYRYFTSMKASVYYINFGDLTITNEEYLKISLEDVKKQLGVAAAIRNGPRFWVIDEITGYYSGEEKTISGYKFANPAVLELSIRDTEEHSPYEEKIVNRKTDYVVRSGKKIYELISDKGVVYTMQSASREVEGSLSIDDLDNLKNKLELPKGWKYQVRVLDNDAVFSIDGTAHVIQDEFNNTYQKNPGQ